jgi:DNA-binding NarL/FixJ family response regulator
VCRRYGQVVPSEVFPPSEPPRCGGGEAEARPPTPRQREVLRLLAEGRTTKGIAHRLGISVKTVEAHRSHLMARLGIRDLAGLVRYAIRTGLVGWEA